MVASWPGRKRKMAYDGIRLEFNKMISMAVWRNVGTDQQAFQMKGCWLDAIGYTNLSAMESIKPDW